MFFEDGVRRIDFILAWEVPEKKDEHDADEEKARKARDTFEGNLQKEGLHLEHDQVRWLGECRASANFIILHGIALGIFVFGLCICHLQW